MQFNRKYIPDHLLKELYKKLLLTRLLEEQVQKSLKDGSIGEWHSSRGQEAITVGATLAFDTNEWILPSYRYTGVLISRNILLSQIFQQLLGRHPRPLTDRFIFGAPHAVASHLSVAAGLALAAQLNKENKPVLVFTGEGSTSRGDFHEAINLAAVWSLPILFIVENNSYAVSTPVSQQCKANKIADKGLGYGIDSVRIDGNNILEIYDTVRGVREYCFRNKKPYLIECATFNTGSDIMNGRPASSHEQQAEQWHAKDPVKNYEDYLQYIRLFNRVEIDTLRAELAAQVEAAWSTWPQASPAVAAEVLAKSSPAPETSSAGSTEVKVLTMGEAINLALRQAMQRHPKLVLMGQDIAEYGGRFKMSAGLVADFGKERVRNTPLCESAILGTALGLSLEKIGCIVELPFAHSAHNILGQLTAWMKKFRGVAESPANVVLRIPVEAGEAYEIESLLMQIPGITIVYPTTPADAGNSLLAAINFRNPVIVLERTSFYREISGEVSPGDSNTEMVKSILVRPGSDIAVITYGAASNIALEYALAHTDQSILLLNMVTLKPLDHEAIVQAVDKTGKVLVLHEGESNGGFGAEVSAWINEHCFKLLDAPVVRHAMSAGAPDVQAQLGEKIKALLSY